MRAESKAGVKSMFARVGARFVRHEVVHRRFLLDDHSGCSRKFRRFIVMAHPRSGASLLTGTLRQHSQILGFGEVFSPAQITFNIQ